MRIIELFAFYFAKHQFNSYLLFFFVVVVLFMVVTFVKRIVFGQLKRWALRTTSLLDDCLIVSVEKYLLPLCYFFLFYFASLFLTMPEPIRKLLEQVKLVIVLICGMQFMISLVIPVVNYLQEKTPGRKINKQTITVLETILKFIVWSITLIILLDNLGVKVSALITGLGIGGIAIALAAQTILGDLFSYFIIFFDRPFELGDFIIVGDFMGTVENIGIKTTRIRSLGGEEIVFSNTDLTSSRLRNYKRMNLRRVVFKLNIVYQTSLSLLKEIPEILKKIIQETNQTNFDRAHFASYGDSGLAFEVVYYVLSNDYNKYMDIQQAINFKIKEEFEKRAIGFAYPTQTLFIDQTKTG